MKLIEGKTWGRLAWGVSAVLWILLLVGAFTYQREELRLLPGEATVLMQARSVVEDGDLRYERIDFDRVLLQIVEPPDLELVSGTGGRTVAFDRPFPYALWLAPFVSWRAGTGFAVGNALLLAAAALWCSWALARRSGPFGPIWVTALVFASPVLASVFRLDGDAFLVAAVLAAVGFALESGEVAGDRSGEITAREPSGRHALLAGICLSLAGAWEFLWLLLPLAFLPVWRRGAERWAMLMGLVLATLPQVVVQWWVGGGLHFAGGVRAKFTTATGFPYVDFPSLEWAETVRRLSALHFDGAPVLSWGFDLWLWLWNGVFLLLGRHLGLLPYAAVVLVALAALSRSKNDSPHRGLWALCVASLLAIAALFVFRPFQLFDAAALGPTPLLPLLALTPLVRATAAVGETVPRRALVALIGCVLVSTPFLLPIWQTPRTVAEARLETSKLAAGLPYETSQQELPGGLWEDVAGLRVRFLDGNGWAESRRERLVMAGDRTARLLVASSAPLDALVLDFGPDASTRLEVQGGALGDLLLRPSGGVGFQVDLDEGRRHVMWWSPDPRWLYFLDLSFAPPDDGELDPRPQPFRVGVIVQEEATTGDRDE